MLLGSIHTYMEALLTEAPELVSKHTLSSGVFIKVNRHCDINVVVRKLEQRAKTLA